MLTRQVMYNFALFIAICLLRLLKSFFLGSLRPVEIETVSDNIYSTFVDTCLALTVFHDDLGGSVLVMFLLLFAMKVYHWLVQGRVEFVRKFCVSVFEH